MFKHSPAIILAVGSIIGILCGKMFIFPSSATLTPIFLFLILLLYKKWKYSFLIVFILSIIIGYTQYSSWNSKFELSLLNNKNIDNEKVEFEATVNEIEEYSSGIRITAKNIYLRSNDSSSKDEFIYIVYPENDISNIIEIGDTLQGTGRFNLFNEIRNPGQFNAKKFYTPKHIVGRIYVNDELHLKINDKFIFRKSIERLRDYLRSILTYYSDTETSAMLAALILGDRTQIDQELREAFANIGVVHVFAVSGLHVGYVLIILMLLVKIVRIPWGWNKILIIFGLIVFSVISGGRPSVIRASLMAGLYILAPIFNRKPNPWNIISIAAFIILLCNPNALFDLGFQLSFMAVISIIFFYNLITSSLPNHIKPVNIENQIPRFIWSLFLVSFSAQIGSIPLTAYYFGRIPIIAIVANIFVIPIIGLFVALGFVKLFFFWIAPLSYFVEQVVWLTKEIIYGIIYLFNKLPFASIATPQFDLLDFLTYLAILLVFIFTIQKKYVYAIISILISISIIIWSSVFEKEEIDIIFLDLGANESVLIRSNNKNILINNGVNSMFTDDINNTIIPTLKYLKIKKIDLFIRGSGNSNHKIGSIKLIEKVPVQKVWDIGFDSTETYDNYFKNLTDVKGIRYNNTVDERIIIDKKTYLQLLLPKSENTNSGNYAILLNDGNCRFLFVDQLNQNEIKSALAGNNINDIAVFKMKYPKRIEKTLIDLLSATNPSYFVITGKRTSKNNPTLNDIRKIMPNQILTTDSLGAIWLTSNGEKIEVKDWK